MNTLFFVQTLSQVPFFATRAYLAAFLTAVLARFGTEWEWLQNISHFLGFESGLVILQNASTVLTHDITIVVLGILAVMEVLADKNPDIRRMLRTIDAEMKGILGALVTIGLLDPETVAVVGGAGEESSLLGLGWGALNGVAVWFVARTRRETLSYLDAVDEGDDLHLQKLISWLEDGWVLTGILVIILMPGLALLIAALTVLAIYLLRRFLKSREDRTKVACPNCDTLNHATALMCATCRAEMPHPMEVGLLGFPRQTPVHDVERHHVRLLAHKRCPACGSHLTKRSTEQQCPGCGRTVFADRAEFNDFLAHAQRKLPITMAICFGFSLIPLIGLIPGIIYYKLSLISSLRTYVPNSVGCVARWIVRLLNIGLICLQPIPILGSLVLPLMCLTNFFVYRGLAFRDFRNHHAELKTA